MDLFIRQRKDGGYSECSSPDHLVGKGRCCHMLSEYCNVQHMQRGMWEVEIHESQKDFKPIKEFFRQMKPLKMEQQRRIIEALNAE